MTASTTSITPGDAVASADIIHESRATPRQWMILSLCFLAYLLDGFDIVIIAFAAPAISADWGTSSQELGIVFSAGVLGMTLGAMFLASLADIYGRQRVVTTALLVAGVATVAVIHTATAVQLIALRFVAGLGLGALIATLAPLASEYSPRQYRTLILAVLFAGSSVGPVVGGTISAAVIADHGWRELFRYAGLLTIAVGIAIYLLVPESIAYIAKRRPPGALQRINAILARIGQPPLDALPAVADAQTRESASVVSLFTPARRRMTLLIWAGFFLGFVTVYFLFSWVPQVLVNAGLTPAQGIRGAVLVSFGSVVGTLLYGWAARWWRLNRLIAGGFTLGAGIIVLVSLLLQAGDAGPLLTLWVLLFLVGVTLMGAFANLYTVALTIYPAQVRSTGLGWAAGLGRCGAVISPAVAGLLIASGISMGSLLLLFAGPILAAAICVWLVDLREMA